MIFERNPCKASHSLFYHSQSLLSAIHSLQNTVKKLQVAYFSHNLTVFNNRYIYKQYPSEKIFTTGLLKLNYYVVKTSLPRG
jgi:competence CoiA-like predicted nuclease